MCCVACNVRGSLPKDEDWFQQYAEKRKLPTSKLLKALRDAAEHADQKKFTEDISGLCDWLDRFVDNRHMAAHGAFVASPQGFLRVGYVHNRGTRKNPKYEYERNPVTQSLVQEAVEDADWIYLVLLGMIENIEKGLSSKVLHSAIPIVSHPSSKH